MTGTLKVLSEFQDELQGAPIGSISDEQLRDILQSLAKVAGTLSVRDGTTQITTQGGWNRADFFDTSRDTQGLREGLLDDPAGSYFTARTAGAGDYTLNLALRFQVDTAGDYEFRLTSANDDAEDGVYVSQFSPYSDQVTLEANEVGLVVITGALIKGIAGQNRLQPEYRGPNGSIVTGLFGQFSAHR